MAARQNKPQASTACIARRRPRAEQPRLHGVLSSQQEKAAQRCQADRRTGTFSTTSTSHPPVIHRSVPDRTRGRPRRAASARRRRAWFPPGVRACVGTQGRCGACSESRSPGWSLWLQPACQCHAFQEPPFSAWDSARQTRTRAITCRVPGTSLCPFDHFFDSAQPIPQRGAWRPPRLLLEQSSTAHGSHAAQVCASSGGACGKNVCQRALLSGTWHSLTSQWAARARRLQRAMAACPSRVIGARRAPSAAPAPARARARAAARRQRRAVPRAAKRQNAPYEGGASRGAHAPADNGLACARRAPMASVPPHRNECAPRPPHWALRRRRTRACAVATGRSRRAALLHAFYSPPPLGASKSGTQWVRSGACAPRRRAMSAPARPRRAAPPKLPESPSAFVWARPPPPTRALFGCARCGRRHRVRDLGTLSPPPSDREGNPSRCCAPPAARPGRALVASLFSSPDGTCPPPLPPRARRAGHGQAAVAATARAAGRPLRVPQRLAARPQAQHRLRGGEVPKRGRYAARPPSEQHRRPSGPARHAEAGAAGGSKSHPPLIAT